MDTASAALGPELSEVRSLLILVVVALCIGLAADLLVDTGLRVRGLPLAAGLVGLYSGRWLFETAGWPAGPTVADYPLGPAFVGAFAVCTILKLLRLGVAGPRW